MSKRTDDVSYDDIEEAIRKAVDDIPNIRKLTEQQYVERYLEALDIIKTGLEMRQDELADESGD